MLPSLFYNAIQNRVAHRNDRGSLNGPSSDVWANTKHRQATVERMGGLGNMQELVGFLMSQPGISGYMGGGPAALGFGAYSAAASGMGVNGRIMAGDGPLVQQMARALVQQVNRNFYTPGGAQISNMTQGLNRDQLGGLMSIMASQGAFKELDMATTWRR